MLDSMARMQRLPIEYLDGRLRYIRVGIPPNNTIVMPSSIRDKLEQIASTVILNEVIEEANDYELNRTYGHSIAPVQPHVNSNTIGRLFDMVVRAASSARFDEVANWITSNQAWVKRYLLDWFNMVERPIIEALSLNHTLGYVTEAVRFTNKRHDDNSIDVELILNRGFN